VNAVNEIDSVERQKFISLGEKFRHFHSNIGDVNINLGFLEAERTKADLLWIVSPNDVVSDSALERICEFLDPSLNLDFVVSDEEGRGIRSLTLDAKNMDFDVLSQASFGMVTGVIYRLDPFRPYLHLGVQSSFLGWGQLAVLFGGARKNGGISGKVLPSEYFYFRGDPKKLSHQEKMENVRNYAHSFFGMVILLFLISPYSKRDVRRWVLRNWYRIGAYHVGYEQEKFGFVRLTDARRLARAVIFDVGIFTGLFYTIMSKVNLDNLKRALPFAK
jgi:hypothetical protein